MAICQQFKLSTMRRLGLGIFLCIWFGLGNANAQVDVLTQHNDLGRTGWNNLETSLDTSSINVFSFGKIFTRTVDDRMFTQPLVATGVATALGTRNLVMVATVNNSVYAFDADDSTSASSSPIWQVNLTPTSSRPPTNTDIHPGLCGGSYSDFKGNFGIVGSTHVIVPKGCIFFAFQ